MTPRARVGDWPAGLEACKRVYARVTEDSSCACAARVCRVIVSVIGGNSEC